MNKQFKFFLYGLFVLPILNLLGLTQEAGVEVEQPAQEFSVTKLFKTVHADTPYSQSSYSYSQSSYFAGDSGDSGDSGDGYEPPAEPQPSETVDCVNGASYEQQPDGTYDRTGPDGSVSSGYTEAYVESVCGCDVGAPGYAYSQAAYYSESSYYSESGYSDNSAGMGYSESGYSGGGSSGGTSGYTGGYTSGYCPAP